MNRLATILSYALALMIGNPSGPIWAQSYPSRPIKLIAPYPAGGPADTRARWLAQKLSPVLGQPIVVENKAGAGGTIGTAAAARSTPDGHTLVVVQEGTLALAPHLYSALVTASALIRPLRTWGSCTTMLSIVYVSCPAMRSTCAGAAPL